MTNQIKDVVTSWRFWGVVLASLGWLLQQPMIDGNTLIQALQMIVAGAVVIRTVDRFAEKSGSTDTGA